MCRNILKGEIAWRTAFVVNDCWTYRAVRQEKRDWYLAQRDTPPALGGGNFLMAHGLFAALNFRGKVFARLKFGEKYFYTEQNRKDVKDAVKRLKSDQIRKAIESEAPELNLKQLLHNDAPTRWKEGRVGECTDETSVFRIFYRAFQPEIDLGFPESESSVLWGGFRNRLSHMAAPGKVIESEGDPQTLKAFRKVSDEWRVNVDRLTIDLISIEKWLARQIDEHPNEQDIKDTLFWVDPVKYLLERMFETATTTTTTTHSTSTFPMTDSTTLSATHIPPESEKWSPKHPITLCEAFTEQCSSSSSPE